MEEMEVQSNDYYKFCNAALAHSSGLTKYHLDARLFGDIDHVPSATHRQGMPPSGRTSGR